MSTSPSTDSTEHFDAIVIGSGIGGLTTAALLAEVAGKRVLVLERHFKLGGFTHSFQRHGYEWDAGVHYVGEMQPGAMSRQIMDLVTGGTVDWTPMGETLEHYHFPEGNFAAPAEQAPLQHKLIERFPEEEQAIRQYFKDIRRGQSWLARWLVAKQYPAILRPMFECIGRRNAMQTTAHYMQRFKDPMLPAILCGQWPDYGACPADSAFAWHATVAADFMNGGYYPIGGSQRISDGAKQVIEKHGGRCLVSHEVDEILINNGKAVGVRGERKGKPYQFTAPLVISNAGAPTTFSRLVPQPYCQGERQQVARLAPGPSAQFLFLGLNDDPRKAGFTDANYWLYDNLTHDAHKKFKEGNPEKLDGMYLTFQSLKDPHATKHTAQLICFSRQEDWTSVTQGEWMKRGESYETKKAATAERMLQFAEPFVPNLRPLIDYQELSTPMSVKTFTNHPQGLIYGQLCDANRLTRDRWGITTSVRNLLLTGADVGSPGVNGAMFGGVMTAGKILGLLGMPKIMMRASKG